MAKILVIDDDRSVRRLLETFLRRKGYEVVLADTGQRGLELFRHECPDIIVLDLKMPGMDGLTVLQRLRQLDRAQPVIMFTGTWTPKVEQQVRALGVTELVNKACSQEHLEAALTRALKNVAPVT